MSAHEDIFLNARQIADAVERAAFLDRMCAGDTVRRAAVEQMLRDADQADAFFQTNERSSSSRADGEAAGAMIGRYKLLEKIGEGGMGVVFMAQQREPVVRKVALKIIKAGMDTRHVVARFEAERQALALMDHPNIAKVLDGGETETGRPYFVMDLVQGLPITQFCDEAKLTTRERLELFLDVCSAIQHAHQKGIIHRDIKPSNILVTLHGDKPVPKVIDFGIAKATQQPLTDKTLFTQFQHFLGTPTYMSPEQASLSGLDIDTRSDIYALGVLLYELLTGTTPFDGKELLKSGLDEMRRTIREKEPIRPSTRLGSLGREALSTTAQCRRTSAPELIHILRGDVDWIVMKCLEKDRARRYDTANSLAMDLHRHLNIETVSARPPSSFYRFQKLVRRKRLAVTASAAVLLALVTGLSVSTWLFFREKSQHNRAVAAEQKQERLRELAETNRRLAEARLYAADMNLTEQALEAGNLGRARELLEAHRPQPGLPDVRGFEWRYFWTLCQGSKELTLRGHTGEVSGLSYSPDGRMLVTCGADSLVKIWDLRTKSEIASLSGHKTWVNNAVFSPDGRLIASASDDSTAKLWSVAEERAVATLTGHSGKIFDLRFSPNGARLATCGEDRMVRLWDIESQQEIGALSHDGIVLSCDFSPDGTLLATGGSDQLVTLWDVASRRIVGTLAGHDHEVQRMAFSPTGKILATASEGPSIRLWDVASRQEVARFQSDTARFTYVSFSRDGNTLAASSRDGTVKLWDVPSQRTIATLRGHAAGIWLVEFSPDGKSLATGGMDSTVKIWEIAATRDADLFVGQTNLVWQAIFDPAGKTLGCWESSSLRLPAATIRLWNLADQRQTVLDVHDANVTGFAFASDGERLVTWGRDSKVRLWDCRSDQVVTTFKSPFHSINGATFSLNQQTLFLWGTDTKIRLIDLATWRETAALQAVADEATAVVAVQLSSDGKVLASVGDRESQVKLWNPVSLRQIATLQAGHAWITSLAFSPDTQLLATGDQDSTIKLWDVNTREELAVFRGHASSVSCLAFSPDSRTLATGSQDNTVRLWNCRTKQQVATLRGHPRGISSVNFSPDGQTLATASGETKVRFWRAAAFTETDGGQAADKSLLRGLPRN